MAKAVDEIYDLAALLRHRHGDPEDRVTFTHVPCIAEPRAVLNMLRKCRLSEIVPADGTLLTHPEQPWYGPIEEVRADPDRLSGVGVTASTWDPHPYQGRAAELRVRLIFAGESQKAQEEYFLWASDRTVLLGRAFYDQQRAQTGYEGDDQWTSEPTDDEIMDFLALVRSATGVE